jgi:hypothetical protein
VISLGIYADRAHAERRAAELKKYAVEPRIVEQPRQESTWWIDVDASAGTGPVDVAALERAVDGARGLASQTCPAVTTPGDASSPPAAAPESGAPAASPGGTGPAASPGPSSTPAPVPAGTTGGPASGETPNRVAYG